MQVTPHQAPASVQVLSELSPFQRERGAAQMLQPGYIRSLLDIFQVHCLPAWSALCAYLMDPAKLFGACRLSVITSTLGWKWHGSDCSHLMAVTATILEQV